jgi:hypothetical protein
MSEELPGYDAWKTRDDRWDDPPEDDSPFCECDLQPIEDEDASNQCFCCGKPLR